MSWQLTTQYDMLWCTRTYYDVREQIIALSLSLRRERGLVPLRMSYSDSRIQATHISSYSKHLHYIYIYIYKYVHNILCGIAWDFNCRELIEREEDFSYLQQLENAYRATVSFHNFRSTNFKLSVSNPKNKYVAYLSVLSQISNCQGLGRKNKHEILKTDRKLNTCHTGVCERTTPPKNHTRWSVSFQKTKSGAGEQFLLLDCKARACAKIMFLSGTGIKRRGGYCWLRYRWLELLDRICFV